MKILTSPKKIYDLGLRLKFINTKNVTLFQLYALLKMGCCTSSAHEQTQPIVCKNDQ